MLPLPALTRYSIAVCAFLIAVFGSFFAASGASLTSPGGDTKQTDHTLPLSATSPIGMRPIFGYGLQCHPQEYPSKRRGCDFFVIEGSPAARAGIPVRQWLELIAVNGRPLPTSAPRLMALLQSPPPLRLTFITFVKRKPHTRSVVLRSKGTFLVKDAASEKSLMEGFIKVRDEWREKLDASKKSLDYYNAQFESELRQAIPNADPQTFAKARNLEIMIGGYDLNIQSVREDTAKWSSRQNPKSQAEARRFIAGRQSLLKPYLAQEAALFPTSDQTRQHLARVHALAVLRQIRVGEVIGLQFMVDMDDRMRKEKRYAPI